MTTLTDITDAGLCVTPVVCRAGHVSACRDIRRARVEKALIEALLAPEVVEGHNLGEAVGGYIECSCGWPTREQWDSGEHEARHILTAALEALTKDVEARA